MLYSGLCIGGAPGVLYGKKHTVWQHCVKKKKIPKETKFKNTLTI